MSSRFKFWNQITLKVTLSLLGLLLICYGNSFYASWQYDDFPNIIHNDRVKVKQLDLDQLRLALSAGQPQQTIARPLAYLTFALNYRIGRSNVFGYHLVNFSIHWIATVFLFLWVQGTLMLPVFRGRYDGKATVIAWISAALWACHPIQVTAVTYIVQRMASMEGMFYVMAMYGYMSGRRAEERKKRNIAYIFCAASTAGALLTKENAVLLIYALLLYDLFFFQKMKLRSVGKTVLIGLLLTIFLGALSLLYLDPQHLFKPYENRPFTMSDRLLTQPRVLFFYLSLIAMPMTMRMSILHDVAISHSLIDPWTTVPALAGVVGTIVLLCVLSRHHRLLAYCGLFYFLNHSVESSFLNLELIYEHRNYVPSMLFFVPVAVGVVRSIDFFYYRRSFQAAIGCGLALWLLSSVHTTINYNGVFKTEYSLWNHTNAIYPNLSAPYVNLSKIFWSAGDHEAAYKLNSKAVEVNNFYNSDQKGTAYYNLGLYLSEDLDDQPAARVQFERALRYFEENPMIWSKLGEVHMKMGSFRTGAGVIDEGLKKWPDDPDLLSLAALNRVKLGRYEEAVAVAGHLLEIPSEYEKIAWMVLAESHRRLGDKVSSMACWHRLLAVDPDNMAALMALIEMTAHTEKPDELRGYVCRLLKREEGQRLANATDYSFGNPSIMPYLPDLLLIRERLRMHGIHDCPVQ